MRGRGKAQGGTGQRLKLSGIHWSVSGATGILTVRCQQAGSRWEEIWHQPHNHTKGADLASQARDLATHNSVSHPLDGSTPASPKMSVPRAKMRP